MYTFVHFPVPWMIIITIRFHRKWFHIYESMRCEWKWVQRLSYHSISVYVNKFFRIVNMDICVCGVCVHTLCIYVCIQMRSFSQRMNIKFNICTRNIGFNCVFHFSFSHSFFFFFDHSFCFFFGESFVSFTLIESLIEVYSNCFCNAVFFFMG